MYYKPHRVIIIVLERHSRTHRLISILYLVIRSFVDLH